MSSGPLLSSAIRKAPFQPPVTRILGAVARPATIEGNHTSKCCRTQCPNPKPLRPRKGATWHPRSFSTASATTDPQVNPKSPKTLPASSEDGSSALDGLASRSSAWLKVETNEISPQEAWQLVKASREPRARSRIPQGLVKNAVQIVIRGKCDDILSKDLPPAAELGHVYARLSGSSSGCLSQLLSAILDCLAAEKIKRRAELSLEQREALMADVINLWSLVMKPFVDKKQEFWKWSIRSRRRLADWLRTRRHPFRVYFESEADPQQNKLIELSSLQSMKHIPNEWKLQGMAEYLLITYMLISDLGMRRRDIFNEAPLNLLWDRVEEVIPLEVAQAGEQAFDGKYTDNQSEYMKSRMHIVNDIVSRKIVAADPGTSHKQISRAFAARDVPKLMEMWKRQMATTPEAKDVEVPEKRVAQAEKLDYWAYVFAALRRDEFDDVLQYMAVSGYTPTVRTYTALIEGWKKSRDVSRIRKLWGLLISRNVPLDAVIWSARISSLAELGYGKEAFNMLQEMGNLWDQAGGENNLRGPARPDVGVVNTTLTALLRVGMRAEAVQTLGWAKKYGIKPDVYTYNMVLQAVLRMGAGGKEDIMSLLKDMQAKGVRPDAATYTIVMDTILPGAETTAELTQQVKESFEMFELMKYQPNLETFANVIHNVIQTSNAGRNKKINVRPVLDFIFDQMAQRNLSPSIQILTIMATHHFRERDLTAVRALVDRFLVGLVDPSHVDPVFWTRLVEGYAATGHVAEAKAVFDKIGRQLKIPLSAASVLLEALIRSGDREGAKEVVDRIKKQEEQQRRRLVEGRGSMATGEKSQTRYLRHRFWHLAQEEGLDEGVGNDIRKVGEAYSV